MGNGIQRKKENRHFELLLAFWNEIVLRFESKELQSNSRLKFIRLVVDYNNSVLQSFPTLSTDCP